MWATVEMCQDLVHYHDSLFIDMRKMTVNNLGWNYFGPAVKDCDMKVCVVAECLCYTKNIAMYEWVLSTLPLLEPRYSLKHTKWIFADNL